MQKVQFLGTSSDSRIEFVVDEEKICVISVFWELVSAPIAAFSEVLQLRLKPITLVRPFCWSRFRGVMSCCFAVKAIITKSGTYKVVASFYFCQ